MEIGGGFGGKTVVYMEPVAAVLSRKTGRPVKFVMTRKEVFEGTGPAPGSHIKVKIGAKNSGKIVAAQAYLAYEAGAFPGSAVGIAAETAFSAYNIPNVLIDAYDVVVNKPKSAPYRAPCAPNAAFAAEQLVDELARKLGMDPIEFRLANAPNEGTRRAAGPLFGPIGCVEILEAMKDHAHYKTPLNGANTGRGVSIGYWPNFGGEASAIVSVRADGKVSLSEGSPDIGGTRASISMQVAEVLGLKAEDVIPTVVDTDSIGYTETTDGSRTTFSTGIASMEAAKDAVRKMIERAAMIWEVDAESVEFVKGEFRSKADPELKMGFKELAGQLEGTGGRVLGSAALHSRGSGGAFCGNIVDLEVDPETGKVTILRYTAFQDAGKAIHPSYVEGQMQGGSVQGIGWALNEEYFFGGQGVMNNSSLLDYRMPTALDLPMIDTVIVEVPNPGHPFGVRGVGEASIVPPKAAIANAIHDAIGTRMHELPMNPVVVSKAIRDKD
jgi:CO/xanthine dehydrogenase Mo-binding subunit